MISASVDNVQYDGIESISVGGKSILLSESGSSTPSLPAGIAEIQTGMWTPTTNGSSTKTITHGCSKKPDIIIVTSNFRTVYSSENQPAYTTTVMLTWKARGIKTVSTVSTSFTGGTSSTTNNAQTSGGTLDGSIENVGSETFGIGFASNRRQGSGLTYRWWAIVLGDDEFTEAS